MGKLGSISQKKYNIILVVLITAFIAVGVLIFKDFKNIYDCKNTYKDMKAQCVSSDGNNGGKKIDWKKLYEINIDIVAWIDIPETPIDYPVVRTKDSDYCLTHDINNTYSKYGSIFIDERLYDNPFRSRNLIIYGHNMGRWSDVMFGSLTAYKEPDYLKKHPTVYLYTPEDVKKYRAGKVSEVMPDSDVYRTVFAGKKAFQSWAADILSFSVREKAEQVLTLSTCTYDGTKRIVLHCVEEKQ